MCVIYNCEKEFPSDALLELSQEKHPDGIGVAWPGKGGLIRFQRGMELSELKALLPKLKPAGTVIHFRKASIGGKVKELTHPFPLLPGAPVDKMEGEAPGVLFQNGTWNDWHLNLIQSLMGSGGKIRFAYGDPWSDARALAFLVERHGEIILRSLSLKEQMRVLVYWPREGCSYPINLYGSWIYEDPDTKVRLGWQQSQDLFLPKPKKSFFQGRPEGKKEKLYYDEVDDTWVNATEWFRRETLRKQLKEGATETPILPFLEGTSSKEEVFTEDELVQLQVDLRELRDSFSG